MDAGTGVDPQFVRPGVETMRLFYLEPDEINYSINVEPRFQSNRLEVDSSYRLNLTNLALEQMQNSSDSRKLYAVIGSNDGRVMPALISGPDDPTERQPKILITSISQEQ